MKDKEKTRIIFEALKKYYSTWGREKSNVIFPELRLGSGYCGISQRSVDFFVINSEAGNPTTAYEIKVSRADFKNDINKELKQRGARMYSDYFYYVTPKGLLKPEEIPLWAGLKEFDLGNQYENPRFSEIVSAPQRNKEYPSWGLICSLIRKVNKEALIAEECFKKDKEIELSKKKIKEMRKINEKYLLKFGCYDV